MWHNYGRYFYKIICECSYCRGYSVPIFCKIGLPGNVVSLFLSGVSIITVLLSLTVIDKVTDELKIFCNTPHYIYIISKWGQSHCQVFTQWMIITYCTTLKKNWVGLNKDNVTDFLKL